MIKKFFIGAAALSSSALYAAGFDADAFLCTKGITEYDGNVVAMQTYEDESGANIVFMTETQPITANKIDEESYTYSKYINAYNYKLDETSGKWKQTWKIHDFQKDCPVVLTAAFLPSGFAVTDKDMNGYKEVWVSYALGCIGDESPLNLKVIMYENGKKHAIRGESKVIERSENKCYGGEYKLDGNMKNANSDIKKHGILLWNQIVEQDGWWMKTVFPWWSDDDAARLKEARNAHADKSPCSSVR